MFGHVSDTMPPKRSSRKRRAPSRMSPSSSPKRPATPPVDGDQQDDLRATVHTLQQTVAGLTTVVADISSKLDRATNGPASGPHRTIHWMKVVGQVLILGWVTMRGNSRDPSILLTPYLPPHRTAPCFCLLGWQLASICQTGSRAKSGRTNMLTFWILLTHFMSKIIIQWLCRQQGIPQATQH